MFEQLTADNRLYGAGHATLAMPQHIIVLLRDGVWTVEQIMSFYHLISEEIFPLEMNFHILIHSNVEGFFSSCSAVGAHRTV